MKKNLLLILGILLLVAGVIVGIVLVNQQQLLKQKAAGLVQHLGQCTNEGCSCATATCGGTCYIVTSYCPDQAAGGLGCQFNQTTTRGASASATFNNACGTEQIDMGCINGTVTTIGEAWDVIPLICQNHQMETLTPAPTATPIATVAPTTTPTPTPTLIAIASPTPVVTVTPTTTPLVTNSPTPVPTQTTTSPTQTSSPSQTVTPNAPSVVSTPAPTTPPLPVTGVSFPTIFGVGSGALLLIISLTLVL